MYRILTSYDIQHVANTNNRDRCFAPRKGPGETHGQAFIDAYRRGDPNSNKKSFSKLDIVYNHQYRFRILPGIDPAQQLYRFQPFLNDALKHKRSCDLISSCWYQAFLSCAQNAVHEALFEQLDKWVEQYPGSLLKPTVSTNVNIYEEEGRLFIDVEGYDILIEEGIDREGKMNDRRVFLRLPGSLFFRFELEEQGAFLKRLSVDNQLMYRMMTERAVMINEAELKAAFKEVEEVETLTRSVKNGICALLELHDSLPEDQVVDRKLVMQFHAHLLDQTEALEVAVRMDELKAVAIIKNIKATVKYMDNFSVFKRYSTELNYFLHGIALLSVVGGIAMLGIGLHRLRTENRFDPRLIKEERLEVQTVDYVTNCIQIKDVKLKAGRTTDDVVEKAFSELPENRFQVGF